MSEIDPEEQNPEDPDLQQNAEVSGDGNTFGDINQIGSQHNYNGPYYGGGSGRDEEPVPEVNKKWSWKSPLTQAGLAWLGLLIAIVPVTSFYKMIQFALKGPVIDASGKGSSVPTYWVVAFLIGTLALLAIGMMRRIVRKRVHGFSNHSLLPAATEIDGHFALARFQGTCPFCDGEFRFYNKPTRWLDYLDDRGNPKRKITERKMAAECKRNPEHWWPFDPTLEIEIRS